MQLPFFYEGVNAITNDVGYEKNEGTVVYYCGTMPVFSHPVDDLDSFRMIVSQLYVNGTVRQANLTRAFNIKPLALKRWVKRYRAAGARAFFQSHKGGSKPKILTAEVLARAQGLLDQGRTLSETATELALSYDVLRKAVKDGRLKKPLEKKENGRPDAERSPEPRRAEEPSEPTTKSQRSAEDAMAPMGVATTNVLDRVMASVGLLPGGVTVRFECCEDVSRAGVLLALPALLACGLLRYSAKYFHLPEGYYTLSNIFVLMGLMTLNRVRSIEELRRSPPGEWGKILGLDRCPVSSTAKATARPFCGRCGKSASPARPIARAPTNRGRQRSLWRPKCG
jgi:transposase-like protein